MVRSEDRLRGASVQYQKTQHTYALCTVLQHRKGCADIKGSRYILIIYQLRAFMQHKNGQRPGMLRGASFPPLDNGATERTVEGHAPRSRAFTRRFEMRSGTGRMRNHASMAQSGDRTSTTLDGRDALGKTLNEG